MGSSLLLGGIHRPRRLALTPPEFESLLQAFATDRNEAGLRYEALRRRLLIVFAARHMGADTAALADETFDRAARRLHEGVPLDTSAESYILGIARNVVRERSKAPRVDASLPAQLAAPDPQPDDPTMDCLERCLDELQPRPRGWIMRFYTGSGSAKIAARTELARELGVDPNALRVRMFRLRASLEACVENCLGATAGNDSDGRTISHHER